MARLLIWNRGEIAVRIAVAAERLGVPSIAAVTPDDRNSLVLQWATEVDWLDTSEPSATYLSLDALRAAIVRTQATHVHPGYGFLSESPHLARAVRECGASLVGPSEAILAEMASKQASKAFGRDAGFPDLGVALLSENGRLRVPEGFRFPLLLKADSGGGGRGIVRVESEDELDAAAAALRERARALFGDDALLAERYLSRARHVELQIFGVSGRGVRVLDSRDCSIQRNHQKVVEEGPAPNRVLAAIGRYRAGIERALSRRGFRGAGTVEVLYDEDTAEVFFLEMNPRIQVEHPVTEMRLGIDLVEWQLREALDIASDALFDELDPPRCHAIEVRVYAEDPSNDFVPDAGFIHALEAPRLPWARWDSAQRAGSSVSPHYDPMIAKLVVLGADRAEALVHLRMALDHTHVHGVRTNLELLRAIVTSPEFASDTHDLRYLGENVGALCRSRGRVDGPEAIAAYLSARSRRAATTEAPVVRNAWKEASRR